VHFAGGDLTQSSALEALQHDLDLEIRRGFESGFRLPSEPSGPPPAPPSPQSSPGGQASGASVELGWSGDDEPLPELVVLTLDQDYDQVFLDNHKARITHDGSVCVRDAR
jgi:hypothetical protein